MKYPGWTKNVIWSTDTENRRNFIKSRYKVLYGGRASSKSWTAAQTLIELSCVLPYRILCTREVQKTIAASSKKLLEDTIERYGLSEEFRITETYILNINTGSKFIFHGLRDTNGIKSMEGIDIAWVEEGETLTHETIDDVFPTIRKEGSEIWVTFNPKKEEAPIYQMFVVNTPPPRSIVKKINYLDNAFVTAETLADAEHFKKHYPRKYRHIWLGFPQKDSDEYTVLPIEMLQRCIGAHIKLGNDGGRSFGGLDLASGEDEANDANSLAVRTGPVLNECSQWQSADINVISPRVARTMDRYTGKSLIFDAVGVGGFAEAPLAAACEGVAVIPFIGNSAVFKPKDLIMDSAGRKISNKDYLSNAKAQQWWNLRRRMINTCNMLDGYAVEDSTDYLSFEENIPDLDGLITEMAQATYVEGPSGRIKIDKAPADRFIVVDGKKKKVKSPNRSDAIGYAFSSDFCDVEAPFNIKVKFNM